MRRLFGATAALLALLSATAASAQDATDTAPTDAPAESVASDEASPQVAPIETQPTAVTQPPAPPIMVIALATGRVPPETVDAVRAAIVAQVEPMTGGRPVLPLMAPELQTAIAACGEDAACVGGQIANAGAVGAIVARLSRRLARGPIDLRIEMIDPISGAQRTPPIVHSLVEGAVIPDTLAPLIAQLRAAMFSPPPPPPQILVTVNVDGAIVRIDGESIGESPVAPRIVAPGRHQIDVQAPGYVTTRREVDVDLGENERIDITLQTFASAGVQPTPEEGGPMVEPQWYERWEIWTGVAAGVVVIGVVIGVSVAVASSSGGPPPDPQGIPLPPIR